MNCNNNDNNNTNIIIIIITIMAYCYTLCLNKKLHPFYFCDNFPNCKPIQIIFGRSIAEKICNNSDMYMLCVANLHHKMTPIFLSIPWTAGTEQTFKKA